MPKFVDAVGDQEALQKLRDETLPVITLYRYPHKKCFQEIRLRPPEDDYWTRKVGETFEVRVRNKDKFTAKLSSCVFKTVGQLISQDALTAGFQGAGVLNQLTDSLKRRWKNSPQWFGEQTRLDILTFEKL